MFPAAQTVSCICFHSPWSDCIFVIGEITVSSPFWGVAVVSVGQGVMYEMQRWRAEAVH